MNLSNLNFCCQATKYPLPTLRRQAARKEQRCKKPTCSNMDGAHTSGFCDRCEDIAKASSRWGCLFVLAYWWGLFPQDFYEIRRQVQNESKCQ